MKSTANNIAEIRKRKKITQQQLADLLGVHVITISKLERGVMQLTSAYMERLAEVLGVTEFEIWGGYKLKEFEANGFVKAGGHVSVIDPDEHRFATYLPALGDAVSKWIHVRDDSLLPFFGKADLLQFSIVTHPDLLGADLFNGRFCMFSLEDADDLQIGIMDRRHGDGTYDLKSMNGRQLKAVKVNVIWYLSGYQPNWGVAALHDQSGYDLET